MTEVGRVHQRLIVEHKDVNVIPSYRMMSTIEKAEIKGHVTPQGRGLFLTGQAPVMFPEK